MIEGTRTIPIDCTELPTASVHPSNQMTLSSYSFATFLFKSTFEEFKSPSKLLLLLASVIQLIDSTHYSYILILSGHLLVRCIQNCLSDRSLRKMQDRLNTTPVTVFAGDDIEPLEASQLLVGHLVCLENGSVAPADLLLVAGANSLQVLSATQPGLSEKAHKALVASTQAAYAGFGLISIRGEVRVTPNFTGTVKLVQDYRAYSFGPENCLACGSRLHSCGPVYGLVLYTGHETELFRSASFGLRKTSKFDRDLDRLFLLLGALALLCALTHLCFMLFATSTEVELYLVRFHLDLLPFPLLIALELARWVQCWILQRNNWGRVFQSSLSSELGQVEYMLMDYSAVATGQTLCQHFIVDNTVGQLGNCGLDLNSSLVNTTQLVEALLYTTVRVTVLGQTSFQSQADEALDSLASALGGKFCHLSHGRLTVAVDGVESIVTVQAKHSDPNSLVCKAIVKTRNGQHFVFTRGRFKEVWKTLAKQPPETLALVRACKDQGLSPVAFAFRQLRRDEFGSFHNAYRNLDKKHQHFRKKALALLHQLEQSLSLVGVVGLEEVVAAGTVETLAVLRRSGIKTWLTVPRVITGTSFMQKPHMLRDSHLHIRLLQHSDSFTLLKALQSVLDSYLSSQEDFQEDTAHLLNPQSIYKPQTVSYIENLEYDSLLSKASLVNQLTANPRTSFRGLRPISENLNYCVSLDKTTYTAALSDQQAKDLLLILLFAAHSVVCIGFSNADKAQLITWLQKNLTFRPSVAAVTSTEADVPMLQAANLGVVLRPQQAGLAVLAADMSVESFEQLRQSLLGWGYHVYFYVSRVALLFLHFASLAYFLNILYLGFSQYSGQLLVCDTAALSLVLLPTFLSAEAFRWDAQMSGLHLVGVFGHLFNKKRWAETLGLSLFHAAVVIFTFSMQSQILSEDGETLEMQILVLVSLLSLVCLTLVQGYALRSRLSRNWAISMCITLMNLAIYFTVLYYDTLPENPWMLFTQVMAVSLLCNTLLGYFLSYCWQLFWTRPFQGHINSRLQQFATSVSSVLAKANNAKTSRVIERHELQPFLLEFMNPSEEAEYQQQVMVSDYTHSRNWSKGLVGCWAIQTLLDVSFGLWSSEIQAYFVFLLLQCVLTVLLHIKSFKCYFRTLTLGQLVLWVVYDVLSYVRHSRVMVANAYIVPIYSFILLRVDWKYTFTFNAANTLLYAVIAVLERSGPSAAHSLLFVETALHYFLSSFAFAGSVGYLLERQARQQYVLQMTLQESVQRRQLALNMLLPSFISDRVKGGARLIADPQPEVTVLFCDLGKFETICSELPAWELVEFIDRVFHKFDILCSQIGVTKIEVVGKTYMACTGLVGAEETIALELRRVPPAERALQLASRMLQTANEIQLKNGQSLQLRIGLNTGPVVAGVVGDHKPQFSLVGDTVNTASRMCSTTMNLDTIQISETTWNQVKDVQGWEFTPVFVEAKGKGQLPAFLAEEVSCRLEFMIDEPTYISGITHTKDILVNYSKTNTHVTMFQNPCRSGEVNHERKRLTQHVQRVFCITYAVLWLLSIAALMVEVSADSVSEFYYYTHQFGVVLLLALLFPRIATWKYYNGLVMALAGSSSVHALIVLPSMPSTFQACEVLTLILWILFTNSSLLLSCLVSFSFLCAYLAMSMLSEVTHEVWILVVVWGTCVVSLYFIEQAQTTSQAVKEACSSEIESQHDLLSNMMPKWVIPQLLDYNNITDELKTVTLLYADIVGFTAFSAGKTPDAVITMLARLYTVFDRLCQDNNVYKVYTIGDCYVVLSCMDKEDRDASQECQNIVTLAFSMIEVIKEVNRAHNTDLNMRIGIHTGDIVGGVVGTGIVRYDIYGQHALLANKMESSGQPGRINISQSTRQMLERYWSGKYSFEFNQLVHSDGQEWVSYFINHAG